MIHRPIYEPKARAREYGDMAINIYTGCNHGCTYCYARDRSEQYTPKGGVCTFDRPAPRRDIVESVKRQIERERITGKLIHLCFLCDPYPADIDTAPTRDIIKAIKESGNNVQLLTKGGYRAERDFDLLTATDWFGITYTGGFNSAGVQNDYEPNAAPDAERFLTLYDAYLAGIKTWISCEPVIDPDGIYQSIEDDGFVDLWRIGKMNHRPSGINWAEFGRKCTELCAEYGRAHYIKDDLRAEMEGTP